MKSKSITTNGFTTLRQKFRAQIRSYEKTKHYSAAVGYTAPYAGFVHEDMPLAKAEHYHEPPTQTKFLETAARNHHREIAWHFYLTLKWAQFSLDNPDLAFADGLLKAAERLLELSNELCPIKTGELRRSGSAYLEVDE